MMEHQSLRERTLGAALRILGVRLKEARVRANYKQQEVATKLGVSFQTVSNWEAGRHEPTTAHLSSLAGLYGILFEGLTDVDVVFNALSATGLQKLPIKGYVSAGSPKEAWEVDLGALSLPQTDVLLRQAPNVFALVVSGQNLQGYGIDDGDTILVDPDAGLQVASIHIVRSKHELCARHVSLEDGHVLLRSSNDLYQEITAKEVEFVGKVVGHIKYREL
jgi:SOS-response transcriptional repressor LexA